MWAALRWREFCWLLHVPACLCAGAYPHNKEPPACAQVQEAHRPFFCLDLSYAHTLLTHGFKIPESTTITLVKRVQYKKEQIEAAWPLGAAINLLG